MDRRILERVKVWILSFLLFRTSFIHSPRLATKHYAILQNLCYHHSLRNIIWHRMPFVKANLQYYEYLNIIGCFPLSLPSEVACINCAVSFLNRTSGDNCDPAHLLKNQSFKDENLLFYIASSLSVC